MDRRRFLEVGLLATAAAPAGCLLSTMEPTATAGSGRLGARWHAPGFAAPDSCHGHPGVFLSHGTADTVLPVAFTRRLADILRADGHQVRFEEFTGGHTLPRAVARLGYGWMLEGG